MCNVNVSVAVWKVSSVSAQMTWRAQPSGQRRESPKWPLVGRRWPGRARDVDTHWWVQPLKGGLDVRDQFRRDAVDAGGLAGR